LSDRLKDAMVGYLRGQPPVAALAGDRVSPYGAHQGETYPRATYYRQTAGRGSTLDGGPDGLVRALVQVDAWALRDAQAVDLANALRDCVHGFRGRWGDVAVQAAFLMDESDLWEDPDFGGDQPVYRVSLDFEVWYQEDAVLTPGVSSDEGGEPAGGGSGVWFGNYFG
jgi:hypothetical protein